MANNTHPEQMTELSEKQLGRLAWNIDHERARRSVEYAVATAARRAIDDEAHRRGVCLHSSDVLCESLEHEEKGDIHRWSQEIRGRGQEWRCSRCHLWLIGLPRGGTQVFEAVYDDHDFSPYVASGPVRGGRDLLFSKCDPAEARRLLATAAREHLAMYERQDEAQAVTEAA